VLNAIVGALWQGQAGGKLAVMGSVAMFDDKWLDSEDNSKIMDWLFRWLKPVGPLFFMPESGNSNQVAHGKMTSCCHLCMPCWQYNQIQPRPHGNTPSSVCRQQPYMLCTFNVTPPTDRATLQVL